MFETNKQKKQASATTKLKDLEDSSFQTTIVLTVKDEQEEII